MITAVTVFTRGGVVLWSYCFSSIGMAADPVDHVIKDVLLADRMPGGAQQSTSFGNCKIQWTVLNELNAIFVCVYEGLTQGSYVEKLLELLKTEFCTLIPSELQNHRDFTQTQTKMMEIMRNRSLEFQTRFMAFLDACDSMVDGKTRQTASSFTKKQNAADAKSGEDESSGAGKQVDMTPLWMSHKITKQKMTQLDFSKKETSSASANRYVDEFSESDEEEDKDVSTALEAPTGFIAKISGVIQNFAGHKTMTAEDLAPILADFKASLVAKNVAAGVVEDLTRSVELSLLRTKTESFTSVKQALKQALLDAIKRVLTQKKSVDILRMANEAKERRKVFSICFLGVNGVGKSTNLAKVAYHLKHKGNLRVMLAACDTFRAGAVEQLLTHARNLDIHLFQQGYGKDPAMIASHALRFAATEKYDVVLIDTAGRMQDNEPLMKALAKLVAVNRPDLVLFVGEALVGNDAVDQLQKFNRSLIDFAPPNIVNPRGIDGIILTKFDTVDDKVGAALTMAYVSGQPVVLVGTGQKYTNLQPLKVDSVLKALLG